MPFDHTSPYTEYNDLIKKAKQLASMPVEEVAQDELHSLTVSDILKE